MSDRAKLFASLHERVEEIAGTASTVKARLQRICDLLRDDVGHYDWVGFYFLDPAGAELTLGPFSGEPTQHVRIPVGRGICGRAAERGETFLVQDVARESDYLSCSAKVRSEIVVPLSRDEKVTGELDIDSHSVAPFTEQDRIFLEKVCGTVSGFLRDPGPGVRAE